jgi:hypothetical protein
MYTINKDASGVTLTCNECSHTVRVNEFDDRLGSRRTQAARAMRFFLHSHIIGIGWTTSQPSRQPRSP